MENDVLSRELLYRIIADNFDLIEPHLVLKQNQDYIIGVFRDSAKLARLFESGIDDNNDYSFDSFNDLWTEAVSVLEEDSFRDYIVTTIRQSFSEKRGSNSKNTYKALIVSVFKGMAEFHNKLIEKCFENPWFSDKFPSGASDKPRTFLSYAYSDKGVTLGLYIYFQMNGGSLYVNWMWSGINPHSRITKDQLDKELSGSIQFLFLRTINSELDYYGSSHIRQWCSWEIGNYYTKRKSSKYYLNFYGKGAGKNDLLSTFGICKYVKDGIING